MTRDSRENSGTESGIIQGVRCHAKCPAPASDGVRAANMARCRESGIIHGSRALCALCDNLHNQVDVVADDRSNNHRTRRK